MKKNEIEIRWQTTIFGVYFILGIIQAYSEHPESGVTFWEFIGVVNVVLSECVLVNLLGNWLMLKYPFSKQPRQYLIYFSLLFVIFLIYRYFTAYPNHVDILKTYNSKNDKIRSFFSPLFLRLTSSFHF